VIDAVRQLDELNNNISATAEALAKLFRDREELISAFLLSDRTTDQEEGFPDPFRLLGALRLALTEDRERSGNRWWADELGDFFDTIRTSGSTRTPEWPEVLDEVAFRLPRIVSPMEAGDIATMGSRTNHSEWSPWALRLVARLDGAAGAGLPKSFFLDCITRDQLATLAMIAMDAPPDAFSGPQMRELVKRHRERAAKKND
jgi:hypothetical protein